MSAFQSKSYKVLLSLQIYQGTAGGQFRTDASIFTNGPAIWGVCVGLRMEVVTTKVKLEQGPGTQPE